MMLDVDVVDTQSLAYNFTPIEVKTYNRYTAASVLIRRRSAKLKGPLQCAKPGLKMKLFKGIVAAIITVTLSSQTLCAPPQSAPSTIQILVTYVIPSKTANATYEMKNLYHFINSTSYLFEPPFSRFPPQINTQSCTLNQMQKNTFPVPTTATGNFTAQMNHIIRVYLQTLVKANLLQGPLTDDMVTIYRNYVLLYSLQNVVKEVTTCVFYL
ncbi:unnamed protein product [Porites evermanni]|uniref:Uncharacterized protein n=1 Tax=Porites evermanni TaxID=104178 RepID=A0ABN8QJM1_9CNID|nr:unnamed protein product [Porites evermanni]